MINIEKLSRINKIAVLLVTLFVALGICVGIQAVQAGAQGGEAVDTKQASLASLQDVKLDEYLGAKTSVRSYLESHENDEYFIGTPYGNTAPGQGGNINTWDCMYPNGDRKSNGLAYMNCTGFVAYVLRACGADIDQIGNYTALDGYNKGNATNATKWYTFCTEKGIGYKFGSISEALSSGVLSKGDIIYMEPDWNENDADCHIGFFWGNSPSDNKFWHSASKPISGNQISEITPKSRVVECWVFKTQDYGNLKLSKRSLVPEVTEGTKVNYSLEGATFGVYTDASCTQRALDKNGNESGIITNSTGYGEARDLKVGQYWVKEITPPTNYKLNETIFDALVLASETNWIDSSGGIVSDDYNKGEIALQKKSANESITNGNSSYSLYDGRFGVYRDSNCTDFVCELRTDESGYASTKQAYDINGNKIDASPWIIFDMFYIKETSAPQGFVLDTKTIFKVTFDKFDEDGTKRFVNDSGEGVQPVSWQTKELGVVYNNPQSEIINILVSKYDRETKGNALGAATLKGAKFAIRYYETLLPSTLPIEYNERVSIASKTWIYETNEDGTIYSLDNPLSGDEYYRDSLGDITFPIGVYIIEEISPPKGYLLPNYQERTFVEVLSPNINSESEHISNYGKKVFRPDELGWTPWV